MKPRNSQATAECRPPTSPAVVLKMPAQMAETGSQRPQASGTERAHPGNRRATIATMPVTMSRTMLSGHATSVM